jgi:sterol desaturase/sphingolipid hydroxylase (fatty acid hydroxylase superfamily)
MFEGVPLPRLYGNVLFLAFTAVALWESFRPRRSETRPTLRRWGHNGVLLVLTNAVGFLLRLTPVAVASAASANPYGLLSRPAVPLAAQMVLAFLALDLLRYFQHRVLHVVEVFWRLHQVHHSDDHYDLTTGVRFHPLEAVVTQSTYLCAIALLAPPVEAVLLFELVAVAQNFFLHANVRIPDVWERLLRRVLITPEMHRVHHSMRLDEQNTNFGFIFPVWDHLLGTYRAAPAGGHEALRFGLHEWSDQPAPTLGTLLRMPFGSRERRSRERAAAPLDAARAPIPRPPG